MKYRLRILCLGYMVRCPLGGMVWHHLQYVLGLLRLGHDVTFIEDSGDAEWACYDPERQTNGPDPGYGLKFIARVFDRIGLGNSWAYHDALTGRRHGPCGERIQELCRTADLVLNLSGSNPLRPWLMDVPIRAYIDTDPGFTQLRHLADPARRASAARHTCFFTFGENVGLPGCTLPNDGFTWRRTRQPVVLDAWTTSDSPVDALLTTVMQWDNTLQDVPRDHAGRRFGRKSASFARYIDLPSRSGAQFELALSGADAATLQRLAAAAWSLVDPIEVTRDPWTYQAYIRRSKAEFSVAKEGYVVTRSGWFSERSAGYLASGRPVVVEDTGFSAWLPTGEGVLGFGDPEGALDALASLDRDYTRHCRRAREIAETFFDARSVLRALVDETASTPQPVA